MICQGFCISGMVEVAWIPLPFPARFEHGQGCEPACEIAPCIRVCIRSPWGVGSSCCDDPGLGRVCRAELVIFDTRGCLEEHPSAPPVAASYSTGFGMGDGRRACPYPWLCGMGVLRLDLGGMPAGFWMQTRRLAPVEGTAPTDGPGSGHRARPVRFQAFGAGGLRCNLTTRTAVSGGSSRVQAVEPWLERCVP